ISLSSTWVARRALLERAKLDVHDALPFGQGETVADALLEPTRIYVKPALALLRDDAITVTALAHITGGGLTENLPRVLPKGLIAEVDLASWALPPLFVWLKRSGNISEAEMLKTFNCGVGMVAVVAQDQAEEVMALLGGQGETVFPIGRLVAGSGEARVVYRSHLAAG
ncbi:MAG TPA: phosphoribosylformylglycinamidine cyclo-ligase, partial [Alphaproteobacteria bacterium]|nr:phosphoribosylformylglycinamidine cyclo-ligase [Alphaproteobacteria bacterium]